ncbi:hypothetical protein FHS47_003196 [Lutibacter sp. SG786]|nr:hypothetical protein [Luteibacter sp. SG786]
MEPWRSLAHIKHELNIAPEVLGRDEVCEELRRMITSLHPDKSGGEFASESDKDRYLRASSALAFIESQSVSTQELISVSNMPVLVAAIVKAVRSSETESTTQLRANLISDSRSYVSRRALLPRIGSSVFGAICLCLLTFPEKFGSNPLIGRFVSSPDASIVLLSAVMLSAMFFAMTWYGERRTESAVEYWSSDACLSVIWEALMSEGARSAGHISEITAGDIYRVIDMLSSGYYRRLVSTPIFRPYASMLGARLDHASVEKIAALQIQRLIERGVISRVERPSLETRYKVELDGRPMGWS